MLGYMLTWTVYGSWLQGDRRGWVKDGVTCDANRRLQKANADKMACLPVRFTESQQATIYNAILQHASEKEQEILAMVVANNHVHLLIKECEEEPGRLVARYKNNARKKLGEEFAGKSIWTRGFNKKFYTDAKQLGTMIEYIKGHETITPLVYVA